MTRHTVTARYSPLSPLTTTPDRLTDRLARPRGFGIVFAACHLCTRGGLAAGTGPGLSARPLAVLVLATAHGTHAHSADLAMWVIGPLVEAGYTVLAFDRNGHGHTGAATFFVFSLFTRPPTTEKAVSHGFSSAICHPPLRAPCGLLLWAISPFVGYFSFCGLFLADFPALHTTPTRAV